MSPAASPECGHIPSVLSLSSSKVLLQTATQTLLSLNMQPDSVVAAASVVLASSSTECLFVATPSNCPTHHPPLSYYVGAAPTHPENGLILVSMSTPSTPVRLLLCLTGLLPVQLTIISKKDPQTSPYEIYFVHSLDSSSPLQTGSQDPYYRHEQLQCSRMSPSTSYTSLLVHTPSLPHTSCRHQRRGSSFLQASHYFYIHIDHEECRSYFCK